MARDVPPAAPGAASLHRHPALVELSRDHHHALVQALALKRAAGGGEADAAPVVADFLAFVERDLMGHFADEEDVLLPRSRDVAPEETSRVAAEHDEMRRLIRTLRSTPPADVRPLLREIGELLHDHVRYEERALFERLQTALEAADLEALGRALEAHRRERGRAPGCSIDP